MNRSRLYYAMGRGMDADAGGTADLQTDVMRFMAILSLCLVAIFALVQSIPIEPVPVPPPAMLTAPAPVAPPPAAPAQPVALTRPAPVHTLPRPEPVALERSKPVVQPAAPAAAPDPAPAAEPAPAKTERAFLLRFESDAALTTLVSRDVVGLYAIAADGTRRMSVDGERLSFWKASAPREIHEMDAATVPDNVLAAWRRGATSGNPRWGVSLPGAMSRELDRYLAGGEGGTIVIGGDGRLRLDR